MELRGVIVSEALPHPKENLLSALYSLSKAAESLSGERRPKLLN